MATLVLRSVKGSALTFQEADDNFTNLNTDKIELTSLSATSSGHGSLTYDNTTGVITYVGPTVSNYRSALSATTANDGSLTYNSTTGVIAYTGPTVSNYRSALSAGAGISYNSSTGVITSTVTPGIASVSADTAPTLGGILNGAGFRATNLQFENYKETVFALTYAASIAPNVLNGNVQTVTLTGNVTINAFTSPQAGQSMTIIIRQDGAGNRTLSSPSIIWAGGVKTLSTTPNAVDIATIFYDGTDYFGSLAKGFA